MKHLSSNPFNVRQAANDPQRDPHLLARREAIGELLHKREGQAVLTYPHHNFVTAANRALGPFEFENVRLLGDDLSPHMQLVRAGATVVDLGPKPEDCQLPSVDPALTGGWGTTPAAEPETSLCRAEVKRVSAKITVSSQLLKMAPQICIPFFERQLYSALANALELAALTGDGVAGVPTGILATAEIGLIQTIDGAVTAANIAAAERMVCNEYHEGDRGLAVVTSAQVRESMRATVGGQSLWLTDLPKYSSPHLQAAGAVAGQVAIVGNFADLILPTWGGITLTLNPFSGSTQGLVTVMAELWADSIALRPESFVVIAPSA